MRAAALILSLLAAPAWATPQAQVNAALRADPAIWGTMQAMAIAREIDRRCDTIERRSLRARAQLLSLYNRARALGYTRTQIEGFIDDEAEKARLRAEVLRWFGSRGLAADAPAEGFCALGRAEIAAGTPAGSYLRAR